MDENVIKENQDKLEIIAKQMENIRKTLGKLTEEVEELKKENKKRELL